MKNNTTTKLVIILVLVTYLTAFCMGFRYAQQKYSDCLVHDTVTVKEKLEVYKPMPSDTLYVKVPADVDTAAVLAAYFSRVTYHDVVPVENYGTVTIIDTIYQNGIENRVIEYDLSFPSYTKKKNFSLAAGAFVRHDGFGPVASIRYKNLRLSAGYDIRNKAPIGALQYEF